MRAKALVLLMSLAMLLVNASVEFQTLFWTVEGKAEIVSNNFAQAETQALTDAFKNAISKTLIETLGEKTVNEKARQIADAFYKDPARFVNRYKIISQGPVEKEYIMQVEVELSPEQIKIGLVQAGLIESRNKVIILAVIQDEDGALKSIWLAGSGKESQLEKILSRELQARGYRLANPEPVLDIQKLEKNISDLNWLSKMKNKYNADLFLLGNLKLKTELKTKADAKKAELENIDDSEKSERNIYSVRAQFDLTIIDLTGQEKNARLSTEQSVNLLGMDQAKNRAIELVAQTILPELNLALDRLAKKGMGAEDAGEKIIEVTGITSYYQFQQLMEGLKKISAIQNLELLGFAPGTVRFSVNYSIDREALKKAVSSARFPEFRLLPMDSDHNKELRFKFESI